MKDKHAALAGFPVVVTIGLMWGDQDAFQHVNNTVYLRWCETARVEYLRRIHMWPAAPGQGVGPIVAAISCDYKLPLTYPDTVHVGSRVTHIGKSSFRMEHLVVSHRHDTVAAEVVSTLVVLDYARGKAVPVPQEVRDHIARLESRPS
jgi:acyl-CoA thioester hydrolase